MIHSSFTPLPMSRKFSVFILLLIIFSYTSKNEAAFLISKHPLSNQKQHILLSIPKGGARAIASEIEDTDEEIEESESEFESESESEIEEEEEEEEEDDDDEEEEEEEEEGLTATLLKSTKASAAKIQKKHKQESKSSVNVVLQKEKLKRKRKSSFPRIRLPYLLRACLSPYTLFSMTKAYFASLINVSYLEEIQSQTLRPSFEEQAKFDPKPKKGKRIMKPGQAKTLSDLPKLG